MECFTTKHSFVQCSLLIRKPFLIEPHGISVKRISITSLHKSFSLSLCVQERFGTTACITTIMNLWLLRSKKKNKRNQKSRQKVIMFYDATGMHEAVEAEKKASKKPFFLIFFDFLYEIIQCMYARKEITFNSIFYFSSYQHNV